MQLVSYVMATKLILYSAMTKKFNLAQNLQLRLESSRPACQHNNGNTRLQILMGIIIPNNNLMMNMKTVMQPPKKIKAHL